MSAPRQARHVHWLLTLVVIGLGAAALAWADAGGARGTTLAHLALLAGGLLSGFLAGLLGIGGALVTIPLLYVALPALGVPADELPVSAVGTSLLAMVPTTLVAAHSQKRHGALDAGWLNRLGPAMLLGAIGGALLASSLRGPVLAWLFAAQALYFGTRLICDQPVSSAGVVSRLCRCPAWLSGPVMAGFCACVGMGGGSMVTPFLQHRGLDLRRAVATASALNLCIAAGGGAALLAASQASASGGPCASAALLLAVTAMLAVPHGVVLAHRLTLPVLRRLVGAINVAAAVLLVVQTAVR